MVLNVEVVRKRGRQACHEEESETQTEEGQTTRQRRSHRAPTKKECEDHMRTHIPFRSWCKHCLAGRGVATQHKSRRDSGEHEVAEVALDYCFLRDSEGGESVPVLVMKDRERANS